MHHRPTREKGWVRYKRVPLPAPFSQHIELEKDRMSGTHRDTNTSHTRLRSCVSISVFTTTLADIIYFQLVPAKHGSRARGSRIAFAETATHLFPSNVSRMVVLSRYMNFAQSMPSASQSLSTDLNTSCRRARLKRARSQLWNRLRWSWYRLRWSVDHAFEIC